MSITGKFVVLIHGKLYEYTDLDHLPAEFDHMISFLPDYPPEPHTPEQHQEISRLPDVLNELMKRETK